MGLPNRNRDFTDATIEDILSNLEGPTEESREFRNFWANYGSCFETVDFTQECAQIDEVISRNRYLMSEVAPTKLREVSARIHELDEAFGRDIDQTSEELRAYGKSLSALTEAISSKGFPASFDKGKLDAKLSAFSVQLNPEKAAFLNNMKEQFGFDKETSTLLWKMWETLVGKNPDTQENRIAYMFNRFLGGFWYGAEGYEDSLKWNMTAGTPPWQAMTPLLTEEQYFLRYLGFSREQYIKMRTEIRAQNLIVGMNNLTADSLKDDKDAYARFRADMNSLYNPPLSDDELKNEWVKRISQYSSKADFAHQSITSATIIAVMLGYNPVMNILTLGGIDELSGWLGDAILNNPPTFGNDDYHSDLDATNICYYMTEYNMNYMEALKKYYNDMSNGTNRATVFLQYTSIDTVEIRILNALGGLNGAELEQCLNSEEERSRYIEERIGPNYHDTYRFLQSLWLETNDMVK